MNYDKAYKELQTILTKMQSDEIGVEQMSKYVIKARELSAFCKKRLREIEDDLKAEVEE